MGIGEADSKPEKKPKDVDLGELIDKMIRTGIDYVESEKNLEAAKSNRYWQNHPHPELRDSLITGAQIMYDSYRELYELLKNMINMKEQKYTKLIMSDASLPKENSGEIVGDWFWDTGYYDKDRWSDAPY